jgi:hypothetical protein
MNLSQTHPNYNSKYGYEHTNSTSWDKFGMLGIGIKKMLYWILNKENADRIHLRPYFLNLYGAYLIILILLYTALVVYPQRKNYSILKYRAFQFIVKLKKVNV